MESPGLSLHVLLSSTYLSHVLLSLLSLSFLVCDMGILTLTCRVAVWLTGDHLCQLSYEIPGPGT